MARLDRDTVKFWLGEIKSCEARQQHELQKRNNYPFLIRYYEGVFGDPLSTRVLAGLNEYFPNTNMLIAEMTYQTPEITVEATKGTSPNGMGLLIDNEENAPIMQGALKYGFDRLGGLLENRIALFDMLYAGYCAVDVNYIYQKPQEQAPPEEGLLNKISDLFKPETELEANLPPKEMSESKEETYIKRLPPLDVLLDYKANRIEELRYIIKKIRLSHSEFRLKYPQFSNRDVATEPIPYAQHDAQKEKNSVLVYEIQQKKDKTYSTFVISASIEEQELDYWDRPYTTNGFNIKIGVLHQYGVLYPIAFAQINKSNQDDINDYVTFLKEVAQRSIPKRGYNKHKLDEIEGVPALNSSKIGEAVPVDGGQEAVWNIDAPQPSPENKELLQLFQQHKDKLWRVSEARTQGKSMDVKFAEELKIQQQGFTISQVDIQEGLHRLFKAEINTLKDLIVTYWTDEHWFHVTGAQGKPTWYQPQVTVNPITGQPMIENALTDILTQDYEADVDIITAIKPNKQQKQVEVIDYLTWLFKFVLPILPAYGKMINIEEIEKTARYYGLNPKTLFIDVQQALPAPAPGQLTPGVPQGAPLEAGMA